MFERVLVRCNGAIRSKGFFTDFDVLVPLPCPSEEALAQELEGELARVLDPLVAQAERALAAGPQSEELRALDAPHFRVRARETEKKAWFFASLLRASSVAPQPGWRELLERYVAWVRERDRSRALSAR